MKPNGITGCSLEKLSKQDNSVKSFDKKIKTKKCSTYAANCQLYQNNKKRESCDKEELEAMQSTPWGYSEECMRVAVTLGINLMQETVFGRNWVQFTAQILYCENIKNNQVFKLRQE